MIQLKQGYAKREYYFSLLSNSEYEVSALAYKYIKITPIAPSVVSRYHI